MEILSNIKFENMTVSDLDNIKDILYTDFDDFGATIFLSLNLKTKILNI